MKNISFLFALLFVVGTVFGQKQYTYESVPSDPLNARIYTLDNGLKVYLTVYKEEPRIQCYIPVKVGSKNDPSETTGLAHYFEHMMFKGTPNFGTLDWAKEEPMIAEIERLFEVYRLETVQYKRDSLYRLIDSVSYEASKLAIPNEYDKMMKHIGSQGTNAGTSNDNTIYIENIPANQLENWAIAQGDRFMHPVLRLFHTELETVYEEKNMTLTNDNRKANDAMLASLFPNHPYGQQTTIGSQEHLKNPSMKNIREFYDRYYVANNMAVCLSGDLDFEETIAIIDKYMGKIPAQPVPVLQVVPEAPIAKPIVKEVTGLEAENVRIAFRIDQPSNSPEMYVLRMLANVMSNGKAGLVDLNLNQKQLVYGASATPYILNDNSAFILYGIPKTGQTLDEVKDLLLQQLELVKKGDFEDWLLEAAINNMKLSEMRQLERNNTRARMLANAFQNNIPWNEAVHAIDYYSKITKQDIINFANKYCKDNYVIVYKRQGVPDDIAKVEKPLITPIVVNRDTASQFFAKYKENEVTPIAPAFVDFKQEITFLNYKKCQVYYVQNTENDIFTLTFRFNAGELNNMLIPIAMRYMDYLGTSQYSSVEIKELFYRYACNLTTRTSDDHTQIILSGLQENFEPALKLTLQLLQDAKPDEVALQNLVNDILKSRKDAKSKQQTVQDALALYCEYGPELVKHNLSEAQLKELKGTDLTTVMKELLTYQPDIIYYGPASAENILKTFKKNYNVPKKFVQPAPEKKFEMKEVTENSAYFIHYDAKQSRLMTYTRGLKFDPTLRPAISLYNQYFAGGMNGIVFQEMREKRSLAYSASARYLIPAEKEDYMYNYSFIATQNDKIVNAFEAFNDLFNEMPQSQAAFDLAKKALKTSLATSRISKANLVNAYFSNLDLGYDYDHRKDIYEGIEPFSLSDIVTFNNQYIKNKPKTYMILSKEEDVNFEEIEKHFGKVTKLTLEDIFGY